jgi:hypothetical protein
MVLFYSSERDVARTMSWLSRTLDGNALKTCTSNAVVTFSSRKLFPPAAYARRKTPPRSISLLTVLVLVFGTTGSRES